MQTECVEGQDFEEAWLIREMAGCGGGGEREHNAGQ